MSKSEVSEKESELIEKMAKRIVDTDVEGFVIWFLETIKPVVWIGGELAYFYLAPFLPMLDNYGYDFLDTFEKRENVELLIKRVEKLNKDKERERKRQKKMKANNVVEGQSLLSKLRNKLSFIK
jgi:hypothetical protein